MPDRLYRSAQVREIDRRLIEEHGVPGLTLMRRAAGACVDTLIARWPAARTILVYCGNGNNAGDGYIIAGMLAERSFEVTVVEVGEPARLGPDATAARDYCLGTRVTCQGEPAGEPDVIVDALLGTGITGEVRETYRQMIDFINQQQAPVLAVDVPSGLNVDSGEVAGTAVRADVTVTFIAEKRGLYTADGPDFAGEVNFASLGAPVAVADDLAADAMQVIKPVPLASRARNSHKNRFGHVLIVGGDDGMGGAAIMAAEASLRTGAGMVTVASRAGHRLPMLARRPEVMFRAVDVGSDLDPLLARATVCVIGPGLGSGDWGQELLARVLATDLPLVVDADGLNLVAEAPVNRGNWVLTPHPGEAARLLASEAGRDRTEGRFADVAALQAKYGGAVLLKGVGTLVCDGETTALCTAGNPGMAAAGMGDVLSGIIGGLLGQGLGTMDAACQGAWLHARAGDIAAAEDGMRGLVASDLLPVVRRLID